MENFQVNQSQIILNVIYHFRGLLEFVNEFTVYEILSVLLKGLYIFSNFAIKQIPFPGILQPNLAARLAVHHAAA